MTDEIVARWTPADGTAWYLTDHLGTVRDIVDDAGSLINTISYDSFGGIVLQTNGSAGDRFTYTGREFDAETGLYYYRARYYDANLGRFISQDPISFAAGDANLYRYVGNQPVIYVDPSGLDKEGGRSWSDWWNGTGSGDGQPSFWDDYVRYFTNPWDMDMELEYGFYGFMGGGLAAGAAAAGAGIATSAAVASGAAATYAGMQAAAFAARSAAVAAAGAATRAASSMQLWGYKAAFTAQSASMNPAVRELASGIGEAVMDYPGRIGLDDLVSSVTTRGLKATAGNIPSSAVPRTNAQLVDEIGTRTKEWAQRKQLTGTPRQIGTKQHKHASDVLDRYQSMFGDRDLVTERSFINGVEMPYGTQGSTRLDVLDTVTGDVWDYKFGVTPMSQNQVQRIMQHGPGVNSVTPIYKP